MSGPTAAYLDGDKNGRLHLQHGPIDLVIGVDGAISLELEAYLRAHAFALAHRRFQTVLSELVEELNVLRSPVDTISVRPKGVIAGRMYEAVMPFADRHFITPMAAVAGAVADEILHAMRAGFSPENRPSRIYVNNGGDIALHLDKGAEFYVAMKREDGAGLGGFSVSADEAVRGIATSGRGGRSFSLGIADSVTVLAKSAAAADAAATIIGNAVDLPNHPSILRAPASSLVPDSDLGDCLVTTGCGKLSDREVEEALSAGTKQAYTLIEAGLIARAALFLKGENRIVPDEANSENAIEEMKLHA